MGIEEEDHNASIIVRKQRVKWTATEDDHNASIIVRKQRVKWTATEDDHNVSITTRNREQSGQALKMTIMLASQQENNSKVDSY